MDFRAKRIRLQPLPIHFVSSPMQLRTRPSCMQLSQRPRRINFSSAVEEIPSPTIDDASKKLRKNPLPVLLRQSLYSMREQTGDIRFKIGYVEIPAHKAVLAAFSPKYQAQFFGDGEFDDKYLKTIEVKDVTAAAFEEYLQFFYNQQIKLSHENIEHVLSLATASLVDPFTKECVDFLTETLSTTNVCQTYYLALKYGHENLMADCEKMIGLNSKSVLASMGFITSSREVVFNMLECESLNCKEMNVFNACIEWAKNVCKENESDAEDRTELRGALGDLLYHIRFGDMTIEEFMICYTSYKELFTEDEREEIFFMIGKACFPKQKKFNDKQRVAPMIQTDGNASLEMHREFFVDLTTEQ